MPQGTRRRLQLVKPAFQLKLVGTFVSLYAASLLLLMALLSHELDGVAAKVPGLAEHAPGLLGRAVLISFAVWLPIFAAVGLLVSARIAGPVHRFELHLQRITEGRRVGRCELRGADEFQDLCRLMNDALEVGSEHTSFMFAPDAAIAEPPSLVGAKDEDPEPLDALSTVG